MVHTTEGLNHLKNIANIVNHFPVPRSCFCLHLFLMIHIELASWRILSNIYNWSCNQHKTEGTHDSQNKKLKLAPCPLNWTDLKLLMTVFKLLWPRSQFMFLINYLFIHSDGSSFQELKFTVMLHLDYMAPVSGSVSLEISILKENLLLPSCCCFYVFVVVVFCHLLHILMQRFVWNMHVLYVFCGGVKAT